MAGLTDSMYIASTFSIENQASTSSCPKDESKDDDDDRNFMQSAFGLDYLSNSDLFVHVHAYALFLYPHVQQVSTLAPIWLFQS